MTGTTTWLARAAFALIIAGAITGCRRSNCAAPADVSGLWRGAITDNGVGSLVELTLVQSGTNVSATYVDRDRVHELRGLRIGRRVELEANTPGTRCPARLHGTAEFCGDSVALTLDGEDCRGALRARGTLQRAGTIPMLPTAGRSGSPGRAGGGGMPVTSAGRGGSGVVVPPTPPCAYRDNGRCDEPEGSNLCPDGTDVADCTRPVRPCAYQNDGECDEPEGTALCDEGQDPDDCDKTAMCGAILCRVPDEALGLPSNVMKACCVSGSRCGLTVSGGPCFELRSGASDASCTAALAPYLSGNMFPGCCRPDGLCGLSFVSSTLGCVLPESLGMPFAGAGRIACGGDDFDAGAP